MNQPQIPIYQPGTVLTVGSHQVRIIKYLTSGGYAQIYSCEVSPPDAFIGSNVGCLKRVIVPDKPSLNTLRAEVDAMKLLRSNKHVVSYIDSHAAKSNFQDGSYEVFLLMEYCERGGLIDFLNTRLQNRLTELEVLDIFLQVCEGVASMHALQPPLIHRDIKIENVLISGDNKYKLCDFGSVCGIIRPPNNAQELAILRNDIMKNTTAQYRAPEMLGLTSGRPIDEKSDIWALGVLLYKLCYYTTPFEKHGEQAILLGIYEYPAYPQYSDGVKHLIRWSLMPDTSQRPNIYQLLEYTSQLLHIPCPIINFYAQRTSTLNTPSPLGHTKLGLGTSEPLTGRFGQQQQNRQFVVADQISGTQSGNSREVSNVTGASTKSQPELHALQRELSRGSQRSLGTLRTQETQKTRPLASNVIYSELDKNSSSSEDSIINSINLPPKLKHNQDDVAVKSKAQGKGMSDIHKSPPNKWETGPTSQQNIKNAIAKARLELDTNRSAILLRNGDKKTEEKSTVRQRATIYGGAITSTKSSVSDIQRLSAAEFRASPSTGYLDDTLSDSSSQESDLSSDGFDSSKHRASFMDIPGSTKYKPNTGSPLESAMQIEERFPPVEPENDVKPDRSKNQLTKALLRQKMREKLNKSSSAFEVTHRAAGSPLNNSAQKRSVLAPDLKQASESKVDSNSKDQKESESPTEGKSNMKHTQKPKPKLPPKPAFLLGKKKVLQKE